MPRISLARLCCALLLTGGFWLFVQLLEYVDWNRGSQKAILLVIIIIVATVMPVLNRERLPPDLGKMRWLFGLLGVVTLYRVGCFFYYQKIPGVSDIAQTTLAAIDAVLKGANPYAIPIDYNPAYPDYAGYKYLPVMFVTYLPLGASLGATGIRLTNLVLDITTAFLIGALARGQSGRDCGILAASAYLMLPTLPRDLYMNAVTDLSPTLPLLAAMALYATRPGIAGVMVGLSVSAKILPGLILAVVCFPPRGRSRYGGGLLLGLIPAIAFFLVGPSDFLQNIVWFPAMRPTDSTSWLYTASPYIISAARLLFLIVMAAVSFAVIWRPPNLLQRCALGVVCVNIALLAGPAAHNNYMLWWIPFFCVLLGATLSRILALKPGSPRPACR